MITRNMFCGKVASSCDEENSIIYWDNNPSYPLKIMNINSQKAGLEEVTNLAEYHKADIIIISETGITDSALYRVRDYVYYTASDADQRKLQEKTGLQKSRGKGKRGKDVDKSFDFWGVAIGVHCNYQNNIKYIRPHNSRIIEMAFRMRGPPLVILGVYAPHAGRPIEDAT